MSWETLNALTREYLPCTRCGVDRGQPCRTASGKVATRPHDARIHPLWEAWWLGYAEGKHSGQRLEAIAYMRRAGYTGDQISAELRRRGL